MNKIKLFSAVLLASCMMFLTSCGEDDATSVTGSMEISITGLPSAATAAITVTGPDSFSQDVSANVELENLTLGVYTISIAAVDNAGSKYVSAEEEVTVNLTDATTETVSVEFAEFSTVNGIAGVWASKGADVAPLLVTFFTVDSIVATFNANQTYSVLQYAGGNTAALELSGTYSQTLSSTGAIWTISVDQSSPSTLTSEGIFEVDASGNPNSMQYEIVQTNPDIGATAPTPTDGFGSSSGGAFGTTNIQVYKRRSF